MNTNQCIPEKKKTASNDEKALITINIITDSQGLIVIKQEFKMKRKVNKSFS